MLSEKTDEALIDLCHEGDKEALDCILERYKPLVIKKARSMFLIGGETEDLIQEGMIGLFKAVQDFQLKKEVSFYNFAKLCINRQIYSAVTSAGRKKHSPLNGYISLSTDEGIGEGRGGWESTLSPMNPEEQLIDKERVAMIEKQLDVSLSALESSVLQLFFEGYSYMQIAEMLGRKEKAVDNALRRIKMKLQHILETMNRS